MNPYKKLFVRSLSIFSITTSIILPQTFGTIDPGIFWSDDTANTIDRANTDGTSKSTLISNTYVNNPRGIAIDESNEFIYWLETSPSKMKRAKLSGSTITGTPFEISSFSSTTPRYMALDIPNSQIYWSDDTDDKIYRGTIDDLTSTASASFTSIIEILNPSTNEVDKPRGIDLDLTNRKIYWSEGDNSSTRTSGICNSGRIMKADLPAAGSSSTATNIITLVCDPLKTNSASPISTLIDLSSPKELKLDLISSTNKLCWADNDNPSAGGCNPSSDDNVSCVNTDGSSAYTMTNTVKYNESLIGVCLDLVSPTKHLVVSNFGVSNIEKYDLDASGSNPNLTFITSEDSAHSLYCLIPEPRTYALIAGLIGLAFAIAYRRFKVLHNEMWNI